MSVKLITQRAATKESWQRLQNNISRPWGLTGQDTGIHPLNLLIGGWIPGKVTTITARSGMGKTAMTSQMFAAGARTSGKRRAEYLFFTWEMGPSYLVDRHVSLRTGLTNRMLTQGAKLITDNKMKSVKEAYAEAETLPVTYMANTTDIVTVIDTARKFVKGCKEMSAAEGMQVQPVIVIDYIGMAKYDTKGLRTYGIADFMNGCKSFANESGAAFCIFAQINRAADEKGIPTRADLSDSQSIEMASDNLILLHRPEYCYEPTIKLPGFEEMDSHHKAILRALKGRDMGIGDMIINCDVRLNRFWNLDMEHETPYWKLYEDKEFWVNYFRLNKQKTKIDEE